MTIEEGITTIMIMNVKFNQQIFRADPNYYAKIKSVLEEVKKGGK